ncbi:MAG: hypothetical protein PHV61_10465 [Limnochordia bacterium]|jgi:hypothetical protein|nr:hypothetical protein [Limnochordia bacterium]MDD4517985.1 hypothetical protein [Limnochordia bacterium]
MRLRKRKKEDIVILLVITLIALAIGQGLPACVPPVQPCGKARYRKANMKDIVRAVQAHYDSLRLYRRLFPCDGTSYRFSVGTQGTDRCSWCYD